MLASTIAYHVLFASSAFAKTKAAKAHATTTVEVAAPTTSAPWYVKAASEQIVNLCFFGGLMGKIPGGGGYTTVAPPPPAETFYYTTYLTETYSDDQPTTLYTTVLGDIVTIYGSVSSYTTTLDDVTYSTVFVPGPAATGVIGAVNGTMTLDSADDDSVSTIESVETSVVTPTYTSSATGAHGIVADIERIESYAHALAEAIIAPSVMTRMLESAYNAIMDHGFIHATQAVNLLSQASEGLKALHTNPAYAVKSKKLAAQPTPINYKKAIAKVTQSHSRGIAKLVAEPSGKQVWKEAEKLGKQFIKDFVKPHHA